jgi:hypothetical protein
VDDSRGLSSPGWQPDGQNHAQWEAMVSQKTTISIGFGAVGGSRNGIGISDGPTVRTDKEWDT